MSRRTTKLLKAALSVLHYSRADSLIAPFTRGAGVIFMMHHVRPEPPEAFEPNRILRITPEFLETVIQQVIEAGFEVMALDEVPGRLASGGSGRPFACFTFDDGYRDNRDYAYPIFKRYGLPFTIYVPSSFADGNGDLWWLTLEAVLRKQTAITVAMKGETRRFETHSVAEKDQAFHVIYWWLRSLPEGEARALVARLAAEAGIDGARVCKDLVMSWDEIRDLARDPLVTIGAHTERHLALAKLSDDEAHSEIVASVARVSAELGTPCRHFSYPYGDEASAGAREFNIVREAGLETGVTTRKGLIQPQHAHELSALPRFSLNGDYQDARYIKVMLSGAPFAFWNALKRVSPRAAA